MSKYGDLLKDPRWQKKRLEILSRDNWTCQSCGKTDKTLHVHHLSYEFGRPPWDYDDSIFMSLCEECHEFEEGLKKDCIIMARLAKQTNMLLIDLFELMAAFPYLKVNKPEDYQRIKSMILEAAHHPDKQVFYSFISSVFKNG